MQFSMQDDSYKMLHFPNDILMYFVQEKKLTGKSGT